GQQRLPPERQEPLSIEILRMEGPEPHLRSPLVRFEIACDDYEAAPVRAAGRSTGELVAVRGGSGDVDGWRSAATAGAPASSHGALTDSLDSDEPGGSGSSSTVSSRSS